MLGAWCEDSQLETQEVGWPCPQESGDGKWPPRVDKKRPTQPHGLWADQLWGASVGSITLAELKMKERTHQMRQVLVTIPRRTSLRG